QQEAHCDHLEPHYEVEGPNPYCFVGHPTSFGDSVALSSDGKTALIGGPGDNEGDGAAWAFTRSGSTWSQQGEKLVGGGEQNEFVSYGGYRTRYAGGRFGASVALSSDGDTALIGGPYDHTVYEHGGYYEEGGAAWAFTRSGSTWSQQGEKLVGAVGLGGATALSADGNTALIGTLPRNFNGSRADVFTRSGSTWTRQAQALEPRPEGEEPRPSHLALSSDGNTALFGGSTGYERAPAA